MKEHEIIPQLRNEIMAATASDVQVRTVGGDQDVDVPEIIIDWSASRVNDANGHNSFGDYLTDSNGNHIGIEHHTYWEMQADLIARHHSENARDEQLHSVQSAFIPYESNPKAFHEDTRSWEVGSTGPRENAVLEPDWYEAGVLISFEYLKRSDETGKNYIETIDESIQVSPYRDEDTLVVEAGDTYTVSAGTREEYSLVDVDGSLTVDGTLATDRMYGDGDITVSDTGEVVWIDPEDIESLEVTFTETK